MLIAVGISGGVGAYKAVEVVRGLQKAGHDVVAIMTASATQFIGPLTLEAITRRRVITGQFETGANADIEHIALASTIDLLVVVPATANVIGKMANGIADDFLTTLYTATRAPVLVAPAMNTQMFGHPAVEQNMATLTRRGVQFVAPGDGYLACGWIGKGRLAEAETIVAAAEAILRPSPTWRGRRLVVTAGPTYEDLDPVRYLGNRSSGRMGFAVAEQAIRRGAEVTLIAGPTSLTPPAGCSVVAVRSALEMHAAVMARAGDCDAIVMAAAVADYRPAERAGHKVAKSDDDLMLQLTRNPDILAELGARRQQQGHGPVLVGFAAETHDVVERAQAKRVRKQVDLIVANDVSRSDAGFDVDTNEVTVIDAAGSHELPLQSKEGVAAAILDRIEPLLAAAAART